MALLVIQLDASSGVSSEGIGFFGISVTSWCNTARSGPTTAFT